MSVAEQIKKLPFWEDLTSDEQELLLANSSIKDYKKGHVVYNRSTCCNGMTMVVEGALRISVMSPQGREITLYRLNKDNLCALSVSTYLGQITFDTITTAVEDSRVLVINAGVFDRIMKQNIQVRCFIYEILSERFSSAMWTMQMIVFNGYDIRLAAFLVDEYERTGNKIIKMTHEQIAQETNSAREVVARMLKRFEVEGLVKNKRGQITLIDTEALEKIKCTECD